MSARREAMFPVRGRHAIPGAVCVAPRQYRSAGACRRSRHPWVHLVSVSAASSGATRSVIERRRRHCLTRRPASASGSRPATPPAAWIHVGAGTVEFIVSRSAPTEAPFFMGDEYPAAQVEQRSPRGLLIDLVEWQLRVGGRKVGLRPNDIELRARDRGSRMRRIPAREFAHRRPGRLAVLNPPAPAVDSSPLGGTVVGRT